MRRALRPPLLAIDAATSHALLDEVVHGCDGVKPGWIRLNFHYFISDTVRDYLIAAHGHRLLPDYRFDPHTGQWHHRAGAADPPLRLTDVRFTAAGDLTAPARRHHRLGEDALAGQLDAAREVFAARPDRLHDGPTGLPPDFERMRWFPLPPVCLEQTGTGSA
ncbi:hypothetical protein [Streptomyces sp. UG1]|uniref:hypothetical protein n=1 Tax=Streptomyces sp. UG1 TaxID=3417652 RepID=UPI003CE67D25